MRDRDRLLSLAQDGLLHRLRDLVSDLETVHLSESEVLQVEGLVDQVTDVVDGYARTRGAPALVDLGSAMWGGWRVPSTTDGDESASGGSVR